VFPNKILQLVRNALAERPCLVQAFPCLNTAGIWIGDLLTADPLGSVTTRAVQEFRFKSAR
jgi:hypothetical protein